VERNNTRINNSQGPVVAIKRLHSRKFDDFKKERAMLSSLTLKRHLHLVKLLTTYTYKGRYHFLCPFAKANLREYWNSTRVLRNQSTYIWVLEQMSGLASALNVIHNFSTIYPLGSDHVDSLVSRDRASLDFKMTVDPAEELFGRHGDLKPENILWFNDLEGVDDAGILQIADLGLGRFHRLESRSRQDPRDITGSPTYIPPELPLEENVSRAYDIWSLGCIFLEFITWLLEGDVGLKNFGQARMARAYDEVYDDTFYMISNSSSGRYGEVREGVTKWIERLRRDYSYCGMAMDLLDVVQIRMLRVQSKDRIRAGELERLIKEILRNGVTHPVYLLGP
jgi:serine/threonine protein kinase